MLNIPWPSTCGEYSECFYQNNIVMDIDVRQQKKMKSAVLAPRINMYMCDVFFEDDKYVRKCRWSCGAGLLFGKLPITVN